MALRELLGKVRPAIEEPRLATVADDVERTLGLNRANVLIGYSLGGLLSFALMISAGAFLLPQGVSAELLGTVGLVANAPLGQVGLILGLVGILFAVSGAPTSATRVGRPT